MLVSMINRLHCTCDFWVLYSKKKPGTGKRTPSVSFALHATRVPSNKRCVWFKYTQSISQLRTHFWILIIKIKIKCLIEIRQATNFEVNVEHTLENYALMPCYIILHKMYMCRRTYTMLVMGSPFLVNECAREIWRSTYKIESKILLRLF